MNTDMDSTKLAFLSTSIAVEEPAASSQEEDETLIADHRAALRPAQRVEQKLVEMLRSNPVLVSHMQGIRRPHAR